MVLPQHLEHWEYRNMPTHPALFIFPLLICTYLWLLINLFTFPHSPFFLTAYKTSWYFSSYWVLVGDVKKEISAQVFNLRLETVADILFSSLPLLGREHSRREVRLHVCVKRQHAADAAVFADLSLKGKCRHPEGEWTILFNSGTHLGLGKFLPW